MVKTWKPILEYLGWRQVDVEIPIFAKEIGDYVYFESIPDTAEGLIPIEINVSLAKQKEIHDYISKYADWIYIGDLNNKWQVDGYYDSPINYQVIETKNLKLEKDTRNQIGQAKRKGVVVREMRAGDDYYACVFDTAQRQNRAGVRRETLQMMQLFFGGLVAEVNNKIIAGCLYVEADGLVQLAHSASLSKYQNYRPNHAVMAELIKIANGRTIYLGNSPDKLEGLKKYKESFGAITKTFQIKCWKK